MKMSRSEWLTVAATAQILKKTPSGIHWLIGQKRLKAVVDHVTPSGLKVYLIHRDEIKRFKALDRYQVKEYPKNSHQRGDKKK